ncbi:MAG: PIN domain-containing protein [Planctomycetes bacterium]|nr:PIN domain-containing protein [Planctomycetota bacterium]
MMDVFVDTNVLLDVLDEREPFCEEAFKVWTLADEGHIRAFVSAISFTNIYYLTRKDRGRAEADRAMRLLRDSFEPVPLDEPLLNQAIDSGHDDLEDAVQFCSALRCGAECLVTRNPQHFPSEDISVLTPAEFLAAYFPDDTNT